MSREQSGLIRSAVQLVEIDSHHEGQRIDNFLHYCLKDIPKTRIYRILRKGEVRVNKGRIRQGYRLQKGDIVRIPPLSRRPLQAPPPRNEKLLQRIASRILQEDKRVLVLNKPSGIAVHGGSGISLGVIEALRTLRGEGAYLELVHRLDRETSGCLVIAKRRSALRYLHECLREQRVRKCYFALVKGRWTERKAVTGALQKYGTRSGERVVRMAPDGKPATTHFEPLASTADYSLMRVKPLTGRTHQIRVHAAESGHPIAGDSKYGDAEFNREMRARGSLNRLFLHAASLAYPAAEDGKTILLKAPLDEELGNVLKKLGLSASYDS